MSGIILKHQEGLQFLSDIPDNSVDLVLTDPPYITSRDSGMDKWVDHVAKQDASGSVNVMTEQDWDEYKTEEQWNQWFENSNVDVSKRPNALKKMKADYLKYGSIYGKKYAVKTNYGEWDSEFTIEQLELFVKHFYRVLRPGGYYLFQTPNKYSNIIFETLQTRSLQWRHYHPSLHSPGQLRRRLSRHGFEARFVKMNPINEFTIKKFKKLGPIGNIFNYINFHRMPLALQTNLYVIAQKKRN